MQLIPQYILDLCRSGNFAPLLTPEGVWAVIPVAGGRGVAEPSAAPVQTTQAPVLFQAPQPVQTTQQPPPLTQVAGTVVKRLHFQTRDGAKQGARARLAGADPILPQYVAWKPQYDTQGAKEGLQASWEDKFLTLSRGGGGGGWELILSRGGFVWADKAPKPAAQVAGVAETQAPAIQAHKKEGMPLPATAGSVREGLLNRLAESPGTAKYYTWMAQVARLKAGLAKLPPAEASRVLWSANLKTWGDEFKLINVPDGWQGDVLLATGEAPAPKATGKLSAAPPPLPPEETPDEQEQEQEEELDPAAPPSDEGTPDF